MKLYSKNENYKLYHGSMLDMLEEIKINSIDSIICDPPYELNFMGKGWDNSGIAFNKEAWKKCYEVLKPGGYLLAFGGSRTFHRIACAIEDAGFEIRDTIMWLYGSGFPKSMDISKGIDKRNGRNPNIEFKDYLNQKRNEKGYSLADINKLMEVATNGGGFASSIMGNKENIILPTKENYLKLKEILDLDDRYDELINTTEAEREVIGKGKRGQLKDDMFFNKNIKKAMENNRAIGYGEWDITAPATDLAKQWQGWGTCLKPSYEPIIIARKPFIGSLVDNVIEYGVGGLNIDECRVGNEVISIHNAPKGTFAGGEYGRGSDTSSYRDSVGRFPANTLLTYDETDFDEVCGGFPNTKTGIVKIGNTNSKGLFGSGKTFIPNTTNGGDSGSAARYFYCAKASKKDRDEGLDEFETKQCVGGGGGIGDYLKDVNSCSGKFGSEKAPHKNTHPTVKPTELMQYLVRLVNPKGATILDCFMGSGSTGKAVMYENNERNANYKFIGIELTDEYLPIAEARISYINNKDDSKKQLSMFDIQEEEYESRAA